MSLHKLLIFLYIWIMRFIFRKRQRKTCENMFRQIVLHHMFLIGAFYIYECNGIDYGTLFLTIQPMEAVENTDITFTCSYDRTLFIDSDEFRWRFNSSDAIREAGVRSSNCQLYGFLVNNTLYTYNCINKTTHSVTLRNIFRQRHRETWQCGFRKDAISVESNMVMVFVKVPVTDTIISPHISVMTIAENTTFTLECSTSPCRPQPKIRWYVTNDPKPEGSTTVVSEHNPTESSTDVIQKYTDQLNIQLNRTWNGWLFFCGASNDNDNYVTSWKILINVTYPPEGQPKIERFENGSEIKVMKGEFVYLRCSIVGGNPLPSLKWNKENDALAEVALGKEVSRYINWQALGKDKDNLTCQSHQLDLIYTTYVHVNVLYPPETPTLKIKISSGDYVQVKNTLHVIEGLPFTLNCSADSNPSVSLFQWNTLMPTNSSIYYVASADRRNAENIACKVSNTMQSSDSSTPLSGSNFTYLEVNVSYSPTMNIAREATIIEGEILDKVCIFTRGNPPDTNMTWSWKGSTWNVNPQQPYIVSRNQSGVYRCSVRNLMVSSDGTRMFGNASGEFNLSVQYKTKVLRFVINQTGKVNITIRENDAVNLTCEIEGLPLPTGQLLHQSFLNQQLVELPSYSISQTSTNIRLASYFLAQCTDTGIHTCAGTNLFYNGLQSVSNTSIALFVICKPRMSPFIQILDTVSSTTFVDVTLSFTALAYPVPPESGYVWTRQGETPDTWFNISSRGNKTNIKTRGLQSNLTIKDVSKFDYGMYRLFIFNDVGQYNHTFNLVPAVYGNDDSSASSSNVNVVAASVAGTVIGVVIVVAVIILMVYRKKKSLSYQKTESSMQYYNVSDSKVAELNIATQVDNANAYEAFQSTGSHQQYDSLSQDDCKEKNDSDGNMSANNRSLNVCEGLRNTGFDQQYEQISTVASHVEKGQPMVYENLQLHVTRNSQNSHDAN